MKGWAFVAGFLGGMFALGFLAESSRLAKPYGSAK